VHPKSEIFLPKTENLLLSLIIINCSPLRNNLSSTGFGCCQCVVLYNLCIVLQTHHNHNPCCSDQAAHKQHTMVEPFANTAEWLLRLKAPHPPRASAEWVDRGRGGWVLYGFVMGNLFIYILFSRLGLAGQHIYLTPTTSSTTSITFR